jgi:hypothetical protein
VPNTAAQLTGNKRKGMDPRTNPETLNNNDNAPPGSWANPITLDSPGNSPTTKRLRDNTMEPTSLSDLSLSQILTTDLPDIQWTEEELVRMEEIKAELTEGTPPDAQYVPSADEVLAWLLEEEDEDDNGNNGNAVMVVPDQGKIYQTKGKEGRVNQLTQAEYERVRRLAKEPVSCPVEGCDKVGLPQKMAQHMKAHTKEQGAVKIRCEHCGGHPVLMGNAAKHTRQQKHVDNVLLTWDEPAQAGKLIVNEDKFPAGQGFKQTGPGQL